MERTLPENIVNAHAQNTACIAPGKLTFIVRFRRINKMAITSTCTSMMELLKRSSHMLSSHTARTQITCSHHRSRQFEGKSRTNAQAIAPLL